jgi:hypothetical protein
MPSSHSPVFESAGSGLQSFILGWRHNVNARRLVFSTNLRIAEAAASNESRGNSLSQTKISVVFPPIAVHTVVTDRFLPRRRLSP